MAEPRWRMSMAAWSPARRVRVARIVAILADVLQLALFPALGEGVLSPIADVLDVVVAVLLIRLVGWHLAFLPAFVAEIIPGVDLVPTWTAAVWLPARRRAGGDTPGHARPRRAGRVA